MKKFILFLIIFITSFFTVGCDRENANILFNKYRFTQDTILSNSNTNVFAPSDRIYYLITIPKKSNSKMLLVQIFKIGGEKDERLGHELVWGNRVKLRDEQVFYYTDYVVLNQAGAYVMKVYSRDNPTKLLTSGNFYVRN
jgi:calcineurin-like phosphoesterase family protein